MLVSLDIPDHQVYSNSTTKVPDMPNLDDLPYSENGGYAPLWFRCACLALSALIAGLKLAGVIVTQWPVATLPLAILGAVWLIHHAVRSATHEAIRLADADDALDQMVMEQINRAAGRTLTPVTMAKQMEGMA